MRYHLRLHTGVGNYLVVFRSFIPTLRGATRMIRRSPIAWARQCVLVEVVTP